MGKPPPTSSQPTFTMAPSMSLFAVNAILILNSEDGSRVFAKYYNAPHHSTTAGHASNPPSAPYPDVKAQKAFEKGLLEKTAKQTADIILETDPTIIVQRVSRAPTQD